MWTAASSGMMMMLIGTNHAARRITTLSLCLASGHQAVKVKLVCITLAVHLGHDILVVIVSAKKKNKKKEGWMIFCLNFNIFIFY